MNKYVCYRYYMKKISVTYEKLLTENNSLTTMQIIRWLVCHYNVVCVCHVWATTVAVSKTVEYAYSTLIHITILWMLWILHIFSKYF